MEILEENLPAFMLFVDCMTQWRVGPMGPTGLDYCAVAAVMRVRGLKTRDRSRLFDDLRVMEIAALDTMRSRSQ